MKKALVVTAALAAFGAAQADDGLTANVTLVSKYKYRGQDQSDPDKAAVPAIQGGFDYSLGGFYLGNWNSSIGFAHGTEMDVYGGYKAELGGIGLDVGALQYYYPGSGVSDLNTTELYAGASWGPLTAKYSHTVSKRYFGIDEGRGTGYFDLSLSLPVAGKLSLDAHVGYTRFTGDSKDWAAAQGGALENYADYKLGVSYDLGSGFALGAAVVGANKKSAFIDPETGVSVNKARGIVSLTKSL